MDICALPTELILEIARYISLEEFSRLLLTNRRHEKYLSPVLYFKLLPLRSGDCLAEQATFTRMDVLQWAVKRGSLRTLDKLDEAEALEPSTINYLTCEIYDKAGDPCRVETRGVLPLHLAAVCGQPAIVRYFLQKGADVNATATDGLLPIHFAKTGEIVQIFVASGSRLDTVSGITPLLCSLMYDADISAITAFLQLGIDPNQAADSDGRTPAQVAVDEGNVDALKLLLEAGAHADRPFPGGYYLIDRAVWLERLRHDPPSLCSETIMVMARMLLEHGASANSVYKSIDNRTNQPCHTPTLLFAVMISASANVVQLLLEQGADQHAAYSETRDFIGPYGRADAGFQRVFANTLVANLIGGLVNTPRSRNQIPLEPESARKLRLLIQHGGNIDAELDNTTPLLYCLGQSGRGVIIAAELIPYLLDLGADPCHQDKDGNQPIHILINQLLTGFQASYPQHTFSWWKPLARIMTLLIDKGADSNARDALGRTPLMLLCLQPCRTHTARLIKSLLGCGGIDVNAVDPQGYTALHHLTSGDTSTDEGCFRLQMLLQHSYGTLEIDPLDSSNHTPLHLHLRARYFSFDTLDYLGTQKRFYGDSNEIRALCMLVRAGADITVRKTHPSGTFDDVSARVRGMEAFESLSAPGIEAMHRGYTTLYLACIRPNPGPIIKNLLRLGATADINTTSGGLGLTPLMAVAGLAAAGKLTRNDMAKTTQLLLSAGADATLRDARGRTAWDILLECRRTNFLWVWSPCLDGLMPEMPAEEKYKLLGLDATGRSQPWRRKDT